MIQVSNEATSLAGSASDHHLSADSISEKGRVQVQAIMLISTSLHVRRRSHSRMPPLANRRHLVPPPTSL